MPPLGSLEDYTRALQQANFGYGVLWAVIIVGLMIMWGISPHIRRSWIIGAAIFCGILLRHSGRSFWYDETFTAAIVRAPNFWGAIAGDVHPPLYYMIAKASSLIFGTSENALRFPSFLAGIALIYAMWRLAKYYTDERTAATTAALVALLAGPIYYSTEARYPIFLALAVIGAMIGLAERRVWLFALGTIAAAYLHAMGIIYAGFLILAAYFILKWQRDSIYVLCASVLWLPIMAYQGRDVADGFWLMPESPLRHVVDMTLYTMNGLEPANLVVGYVTVIAFSCVGVYMSREWIQKKGLVWLVIAAGVPLAAGIISALWHPVYLSRAMLAPALLLVIAWAWAWDRLHWFFRASLVFAVVNASGGLIQQPGDLDLREVFEECRGADTVYATSTNVAIMAMYYSPVPVVTWSGGDNLHQQLSPETKAAMGMIVQDNPPPTGKVCAVVQKSYHTTHAEEDQIRRITGDDHKITQKTVFQDRFYSYEVLKWDASSKASEAVRDESGR